MNEDKKVSGGVGPAGSLMLGLLIQYGNPGKEAQHWPGQISHDRPKTYGTIGYILGFWLMVLREAHSLHTWAAITRFLPLLSLI